MLSIVRFGWIELGDINFVNYFTFLIAEQLFGKRSRIVPNIRKYFIFNIVVD